MKSLPQTAIKIDIGTHEVYALVDPRNKRVRYVGQTCHGAKSRYYSHLRCNPRLKHWIGDLHDQGLRPILFLLEITDWSNARKREKYWISYFEDNKLFNGQHHDLTEIVSVKNNLEAACPHEGRP